MPSSKLKVLLTEIDESGWLLVILMPLEDIYLDSQVVCSCNESSEIPFRFMRTIEAMIAGPEITSFFDISSTILTPKEATFYWNFP